MERYHITKRGTGWALRRESARKATKIFDTKSEAKRGAEKYRAKGYDIIVHKKNGYVEECEKGE
jgi:hypothetical protein